MSFNVDKELTRLILTVFAEKGAPADKLDAVWACYHSPISISWAVDVPGGVAQALDTAQASINNQFFAMEALLNWAKISHNRCYLRKQDDSTVPLKYSRPSFWILSMCDEKIKSNKTTAVIIAINKAIKLEELLVSGQRPLPSQDSASKISETASTAFAQAREILETALHQELPRQFMF
ncbi:protein ORF32 [Anguillid herpesvirus 1]|uniref:Protein ORF32 n=1 Tax=Anguillid herpesvirus 1 TaxID=150286 RepID=A0A1J0REA4_9VIRU|nr:protein ORF32 [Anguillid herpesvirus 1]ADA57795.1 protein ORF32 [Anguillid herpesvirus 1]APD76195.1 ORF32 [Anguillid herpesvirus 1]QRM16326.1 protein ORF32 [Anguillid herpesvirus 1]QRM16456.1 protein ORF32 [Anguillid herpesvirus 1]QRM16585.1 protein ORF32 [Anguillid herpesvirus 1]